MTRPNVLLFMPDQQRADVVGCFGNPVVHTPNIDALARRGTRFTQAWSQHSVCSPSRVSLMTGWYPHVAGHRTLEHLLRPDEPNLLRLMRDAGYRVCMLGNRGDVFAPGVTEASTDFCGYLVHPDAELWTRTRVAYPEGHRMTQAFYMGNQGDETRVDSDEATVRTALQLIEEIPRDRPWLMWMPLLNPHPPFMVEEPWFSLHDRSTVPAPIPRDAAVGKAAFIEAYRAAYGWGELDDADLREIIATYYGMVSRTDEQLGRVVNALERTGQLDNTLVLYFTDHGEYLGDHGLVEKWPSGLDACLVRNPLIVAGPGVAAGAVSDALVEMIDVLPTLLEAAECAPRHTHFGRSLVDVLADPSTRHRDHVFCEGGFSPTDVDLFERSGWLYAAKSTLQHEHPELVSRALCVRSREFTYVYRQSESDELYDRVADPAEVVNVVDDPALTTTRSELRERLFKWLVDTSDVAPWKGDPRFPDTSNGWH